jgi:hypothetical protein
MTLGGKRMQKLGRMQWAGILLASASAALMFYLGAHSDAPLDAQSSTVMLMPVKGLLLAGIAGLLAGGILVQLTWRVRHE